LRSIATPTKFMTLAFIFDIDSALPPPRRSRALLAEGYQRLGYSDDGLRQEAVIPSKSAMTLGRGAGQAPGPVTRPWLREPTVRSDRFWRIL
jgi:hypothetical protein